VDDVRAAIKRHFLGEEPFEIDRPRWWTQRQRAILYRITTDAAPLAEL
jgi:hypothetical protein